MKIKIMKIYSEGLLRLFMKFSTPQNYQSYGITVPEPHPQVGKMSLIYLEQCLDHNDVIFLNLSHYRNQIHTMWYAYDRICAQMP